MTGAEPWADVRVYTVPMLMDPTILSWSWVEPWEVLDDNPFPKFTPFPRVQQAIDRAALIRSRLSDALHALRHGIPEEYDE